MNHHNFITEVSENDGQFHLNLIIAGSYHSYLDLPILKQNFFVLKDALLQSNDLLFRVSIHIGSKRLSCLLIGEELLFWKGFLRFYIAFVGL